MDINFDNITINGEYSVSIGSNPAIAQGNRLVANIFEITLMTNINDSLLSNGYGGNGVVAIKTGFDPNDLQSIASMVKVACDNAVMMMKADQTNITNIPKIEKISSAYVIEVNKIRDKVAICINIIPEEYEPQYIEPGLRLTLPL